MKLLKIASFGFWLSFFFTLGNSAFAVSMNFGGNFRTEAAYYSKLGQDLTGSAPQKQYIRGRLLLTPSVVVDDHFSVKSQWSLLESGNFVPSMNNPAAGGQGGFVFGDPNTTELALNRAWLEWTSDFGVVRLGRMPVAWGYGLVWDAGSNLWDDYGSTLDRIEYRLHLGSIIGALAYSKPRKLSVLGHGNDADFFTVYLQYNNPESDVEGGVLFEKHNRSSGQPTDVTTGTGNPWQIPGNPFPLSTKAPATVTNNLLDVYLRKSLGYFTFGGEVAWLSGTSTDYNGTNNIATDLNGFAALGSLSYEYHKIKLFTELMYVSGDDDLTNTKSSAFILIHRNRQRGGLIFRELIGSPAVASGNNAGQGTFLAYGNTTAFSGFILFRPGFRVDWSPSWASGIEVLWVKKASTQSGEESGIGTEIDLGTDYSVYKNFDLGVAAAFLFPGKGVVPANTDTKMIFGFHTTASLKF